MKTAARFAAAILAACVLTLPAVAEDRERVRVVNVNGYTVVDNQHVILSGSASRRYLVTLQRRCWGLRRGIQIGTSFGRTATIYNPRFEYIVTRDDPRCYIRDIEQVENEDAALALIEQRAAEAEAEDDTGSR
ncbi:DUF6491 family protein [Maricaulis sp.]|uniref:DUF6491 family protein n=1 Tax=Maricaulis sp. TaxID=1486257 RepID=UPI00260E52E8|nr:DUF6491 family protein [Maricaulis sp.]